MSILDKKSSESNEELVENKQNVAKNEVSAQEIKAFLANFPDHFIQTFDDRPEKDKSLTRSGPPSNFSGTELSQLNAQGAGIFFSPNRFSKQRKKELCEGVNAWYMEIDGISKQEQWEKIKKSPLRPSAIVDSRNSLHCYWFAKDGTIENFDRIIRGIIQYFNSDTACKDITRVFRIPGFYHNKQEPYLVTIKSKNYDAKYTENEMMEAFPYHGIRPVNKSNNAQGNSNGVSKVEKWATLNEGMGKGQRNSAATKVCGKLIQSYGLNRKKVWEELKAWDLKNTPPLQSEGGELKGVFNSIFNRAGRDRLVKASKDLNYLQGMDQSDLRAQAFMSEKDIIHYDRQWFEYHEGVWRRVATDEIKGYLAEFYIQNSAEYSRKIINDTFEFLASRIALEYRAQIEPKIKNKSKRGDELAASNGILDIKNLELRRYKKEDYIFTKLPFPYKKDFNCPLWEKFLSDVFSEYDALERRHIIEFVQEWMGYSLIADTSLESFIILIGGGANGKSVFLNIWKSILGEENVASIDLKDINGEQYVSMLFGKMANICTDIQSGQQLDSGIFKRLVSGDTVTAKEVYKRPFQFTPYARLIFSTNSLPYLRNVDNAMRRRTHILRFNRTFQRSEQDRNLYKKLRKELPGIFNWSVVGLSRLKARGHFDEPESVINEVEGFMKQNDIVALWMEEGEIKPGKCWVNRTLFYEDFRTFCEANGRHAPSASKFYQYLINNGFNKHKTNGKRGFLIQFNEGVCNFPLDFRDSPGL